MGQPNEVELHLLYTQDKNDVLRGKYRMTSTEALLLAALTLQIEAGDHNPEKHTGGFLREFVKRNIPKDLYGLQKPEIWDKDTVSTHLKMKGFTELMSKQAYTKSCRRIAGEQQRAIGEADQQMAGGTRLRVAGHGDGVYVGWSKKRIGANEHSVRFGGEVRALKLHDLEWQVLGDVALAPAPAPALAPAPDDAAPAQGEPLTSEWRQQLAKGEFVVVRQQLHVVNTVVESSDKIVLDGEASTATRGPGYGRHARLLEMPGAALAAQIAAAIGSPNRGPSHEELLWIASRHRAANWRPTKGDHQPELPRLPLKLQIAERLLALARFPVSLHVSDEDVLESVATVIREELSCEHQYNDNKNPACGCSPTEQSPAEIAQAAKAAEELKEFQRKGGGGTSTRKSSLKM
jgi:hypothetical protein